MEETYISALVLETVFCLLSTDCSIGNMHCFLGCFLITGSLCDYWALKSYPYAVAQWSLWAFAGVLLVWFFFLQVQFLKKDTSASPHHSVHQHLALKFPSPFFHDVCMVGTVNLVSYVQDKRSDKSLLCGRQMRSFLPVLFSILFLTFLLVSSWESLKHEGISSQT